ncbi:MAG: hypothetical protein AB9866_27895 [Syntrophobacteraceae bacterium]
MDGNVIALIEVKPSPQIIFRGMPDQLSETTVDLAAPTESFHITKVESSLSERIEYRLETVTEGKHYRLKVSNKANTGNYGGHIRLYTDLTLKPEVLIRVNGFIEGAISVKPQAILVGKLSATQPERTGRIVVTSNRNQPFKIVGLSYDEKFLSVVQQPLENGSGFSLEIQPKLGSVPVGSRQQTILTIETDAGSGQKDDVQVHLFNSADQPEAAPK